MTTKVKISQRTKNRLREHNTWIIIMAPRSIPALDNKPCMFIGCRDCDWKGWIPLDEYYSI